MIQHIYINYNRYSLNDKKITFVKSWLITEKKTQNLWKTTGLIACAIYPCSKIEELNCRSYLKIFLRKSMIINFQNHSKMIQLALKNIITCFSRSWRDLILKMPCWLTLLNKTSTNLFNRLKVFVVHRKSVVNKLLSRRISSFIYQQTQNWGVYNILVVQNWPGILSYLRNINHCWKQLLRWLPILRLLLLYWRRIWWTEISLLLLQKVINSNFWYLQALQ